ncbi:hypothetical protein B0H17DRAFT_1144724 [Mycena rosella]|uniref:Uncharacterized protein n=1 Tax=Mycena rosella TaxID=1033263 RepID=A0AAD7G348_MYCRO|nr:hypothetical protein B0H17DRAFT_1144724 [Mycena rosella]
MTTWGARAWEAAILKPCTGCGPTSRTTTWDAHAYEAIAGPRRPNSRSGSRNYPGSELPSLNWLGTSLFRPQIHAAPKIPDDGIALVYSQKLVRERSVTKYTSDIANLLPQARSKTAASRHYQRLDHSKASLLLSTSRLALCLKPQALILPPRKHNGHYLFVEVYSQSRTDKKPANQLAPLCDEPMAVNLQIDYALALTAEARDHARLTRENIGSRTSRLNLWHLGDPYVTSTSSLDSTHAADTYISQDTLPIPAASVSKPANPIRIPQERDTRIDWPGLAVGLVLLVSVLVQSAVPGVPPPRMGGGGMIPHVLDTDTWCGTTSQLSNRFILPVSFNPALEVDVVFEDSNACASPTTARKLL